MKTILASLAVFSLAASFAHAQVTGAINSDGFFVITGNGEVAAGVDLISADGLLIPAADPPGAAPFQFLLSNTASQITWGNLGAGVTLDGEFVTGAGYTGDDPANDLTAAWGDGSNPVAFPIGAPAAPVDEIIPEPATGILSAFAVIGMLGFRRRRAN